MDFTYHRAYELAREANELKKMLVGANISFIFKRSLEREINYDDHLNFLGQMQSGGDKFPTFGPELRLLVGDFFVFGGHLFRYRVFQVNSTRQP